MHTKHTDKHWTLHVHNSASTEHTGIQGTGLLVEDTEPNLQYTLASSHGPSASTSSYTALRNSVIYKRQYTIYKGTAAEITALPSPGM